jgi:hypothetical protein
MFDEFQQQADRALNGMPQYLTAARSVHELELHAG